MAIDANGNETWGLVEWALGGLATLVGSGLAFVWRLMLRIEKLESNQGRQRAELDTMRESSDGAMLRLAERFAQLHDDHFRLREAMGAMPTRSDLRELEDRLTIRLSALSDRIDRAIDA